MATAQPVFPAALRRSMQTLKKLEASPEQKRYILAKAAHSAAKMSVAADMELLKVPPPSRDEIRAIVAAMETTGETITHPWYEARGVIEDRWKLHERWREELEAGAALIVWGAANARRGLGERYGTIAVAFERGPSLSGRLREQLLDICVRMEVSHG